MWHLHKYNPEIQGEEERNRGYGAENFHSVEQIFDKWRMELAD